METTTSQIAKYLQRFRKGDRDGAFFGLLEMEHGILPELMAAFRSERDSRVREFLVEIIWQHRQASTIPFLKEALHDGATAMWKQALDGLVALASSAALDVLRDARTTRQFPTQREAEEFRRWLDEAIEQFGGRDSSSMSVMTNPWSNRGLRQMSKTLARGLAFFTTA